MIQDENLVYTVIVYTVMSCVSSRPLYYITTDNPSAGVVLAIMESLGYIIPIYNEQNCQKIETLSPGAVAAGYQNFLICIEARNL